EHPHGEDIVGAAPAELPEGEDVRPQRSGGQRVLDGVAREGDRRHVGQGRPHAAGAEQLALKSTEGDEGEQLGEGRHPHPLPAQVLEVRERSLELPPLAADGPQGDPGHDEAEEEMERATRAPVSDGPRRRRTGGAGQPRGRCVSVGSTVSTTRGRSVRNSSTRLSTTSTSVPPEATTSRWRR